MNIYQSQTRNITRKPNFENINHFILMPFLPGLLPHYIVQPSGLPTMGQYPRLGLRMDRLVQRGREQGPESREQEAESKEQGAGSKDQKAGSIKKGVKSREQKAGSKKQGAGCREQGVVLSNHGPGAFICRYSKALEKMTATKSHRWDKPILRTADSKTYLIFY